MELKLIALVCSIFLAGCASSSIVGGNTRPPISPDAVRIYLDPPARYEKIALVDAGSRNSWAISDQGKTNKVIARMKEAAAGLGANGVLIGGVGDQQVGSVGYGQAWGYGNSLYVLGVQSAVFQKKGQGLAIYVFEEATPPPAAAQSVPAHPVQQPMAAPAPAPRAEPAAKPAASTPAGNWRNWGQ
jgi:hypothetical protein